MFVCMPASLILPAVMETVVHTTDALQVLDHSPATVVKEGIKRYKYTQNIVYT